MVDLNKKLKSRVSEIFKDGMSPFERHVVDEMDVMRQQNELCMQGLHEVREQALKTNGRVNELEKRAAETDATIGGIKQLKSWLLWAAGGIGGLVLYLADKVITRWFSCIVAFLGLALCGCSTPTAAVQHRKPESAPVSRPMAETRLAITETRSAVRKAAETAQAGVSMGIVAQERAASLAQASSAAAEKGLVAKSAEAVALATEAAWLAQEVEGLRASLFRVTMELRDAATNSAVAEARNAEAEQKLVEYDRQVAEQTAALNAREVELASERVAQQQAVQERREAVGALAALRWKIGAGLTLGGLVVVAAFYFRLIKFGL